MLPSLILPTSTLAALAPVRDRLHPFRARRIEDRGTVAGLAPPGRDAVPAWARCATAAGRTAMRCPSASRTPSTRPLMWKLVVIRQPRIAVAEQDIVDMAVAGHRRRERRDGRSGPGADDGDRFRRGAPVDQAAHFVGDTTRVVTVRPRRRRRASPPRGRSPRRRGCSRHGRRRPISKAGRPGSAHRTGWRWLRVHRRPVPPLAANAINVADSKHASAVETGQWNPWHTSRGNEWAVAPMQPQRSGGIDVFLLRAPANQYEKSP